MLGFLYEGTGEDEARTPIDNPSDRVAFGNKFSTAERTRDVPIIIPSSMDCRLQGREVGTSDGPRRDTAPSHSPGSNRPPHASRAGDPSAVDVASLRPRVDPRRPGHAEEGGGARHYGVRVCDRDGD